MAEFGATHEQLLAQVAALRGEVQRLRATQELEPRLEDDLLQDRRRFRDLVQMMNEGLVVADATGCVVFANGRASEILGTNGDEVLGRRVRDFIAPDEIPLYEAQLAMRRGGRTSRYELTLRREDGLPLYALVSARPIFDVEDRFAGSLAVLTDISERRRVEEALRASEARLRDIVEHSTNLFYSHSPEHVLTYVSPRAKTFLGCEPEEAMVRWTEFVTDHPVNEEAMALTQKAIDTGERQPPYDLQLRTRDGRLLWVAVHEAPIVEDGRTVAIVGALQEVTERRRMEALLRIELRLGLALGVVRTPTEASRTTLMAALEIDDIDSAGLYLVDAATGDLELVDHVGLSERFAEEMRRVPADDARAIRVRETRDAQLAYSDEAMRLEGILTTIVFPIRHEGRLLACLNVGSRMVGAFSKIVASAVETIASQLGPVLSRFQAQASLEHSEATLRSLMGAAPAGIGLVRDRVFQWVNEHMVRLTGYDAEALLGHNARMLYESDEEFARVGRVKYGQILSTGVGMVETKWRRADGTVLDVALSSAALDREDLSAGAVFTASDVTERNRTEAERRRLEGRVQHAQKLESLGMLAGGIAHDFNNIVHAILGYANLAGRLLDGSSPATAHLAEIEHAAARAGELCHQMLAYSGRGSFVIRRIHLGEVVRETVDLLRASLPKKVAFEVEVEGDLPAIEADATQMQQVVLNLVTNAAESIGSESGCVRLRVATATRGGTDARRGHGGQAAAGGRYVTLMIEDTGCGMDADTRDKMFEPFFTTKFAGRGLGLSAVQGIVRGHGGEILVVSEPGRGSTLTVLLPAVDAVARAARKPKAPADEWQGGGTILLADDEPGVRTLGKAMLENAGFDVVAVADGQQALEAFAARGDEFVCVVLDLTMPVMDGAEAFTELRKVRPDVPVILCSGYSEQELRDRFDADVPAGFLQKPFTWDSFRERLALVLAPHD